MGEHVILDASWGAAEHRRWATKLAERTHAELLRLRCEAPPSVTAERIARRAAGPSDATASVASAMALDADPWPDATTVATTHDPPDSVALTTRAWVDAALPR